MVNSPGKLIVLSPVGALREAALGVASASTEAFCVTESPLEALWTLARNPANDLLINIRCLAFREREILQAARAASASAHLVVMAEPADELHLARVATSVDELAVGSAEVRGVAARRLSAATDERSNPGVMCVAGSIDTFSPELSASTGDSCQDRAAEGRGESLLSQAVLCLRQMTERPTADTPEALAALLSEALLTMPGVEAAALLVLEARPGAEASQLLALAGGGLSVDEALSARRVNGDRAWSSAGRRR